MSHGKIQVSISADPAKVDYSRDLILTVRITAPSTVDAALPSLADRLEGFILNGVIDKESIGADGKAVRERRALLTPMLAEEHRLAPMAIAYTDKGASPPQTGWFPTRSMVFEALPPFQGKPGSDIKVSMNPMKIYPSFKTVVMYVLIGILCVAALIGLWKLMGKVHHQIKLMRMSAKERALYELTVLLGKDLIGKSLVKEFYLELTMIVRRYIERRHSIRAPKQTTEEFLAAVAGDQRFSKDVVSRLKMFLEAADLVKFAAYRPPVDSIGNAADTARNYIERDAAEADERQGS